MSLTGSSALNYLAVWSTVGMLSYLVQGGSRWALGVWSGRGLFSRGRTMSAGAWGLCLFGAGRKLPVSIPVGCNQEPGDCNSHANGYSVVN